MSPSPGQRSRATRTPPEAPRPEVLQQSSLPGSPNVRDAAWRLFLSRLPHSHTARAPKTTLSVPIQWNVTAQNSSETPRPSRRQSRVSVIAELSHGPKLHHVRAQDTGGDGDPRLPPRPTSRTSPGRESRTGRPHPSRVHPTGVISRLSGGGEDQETRGGFPPGPDPSAVLHRGEGPKCIPGLSWPTRTPPPTLPTWP